MTDVKNSSLATDLVSYWELEEASGTRFDSHGANNLTDNNTVGSAAGKVGNAADFDRASGEFLNNTTIMSGISTAFTFSGWFKFPNIGGANQTVFSVRPGSGAQNLIQVETYVDPTVGNLRLIGFNSSGQNRKDYQFRNGLAADTWGHFAVTWDGSTLHFYKDGSTAGVHKQNDGAWPLTATSRNLRVGAETNTGNIADGLIDELGVWTRALTAAEVAELYNSGAGIPYDAGGGGGGAAQTARRGVVMMM